MKVNDQNWSLLLTIRGGDWPTR